MSTTKVFTVTAYRWGSHENHSYIEGVYFKKLEALKAAEFLEEERGGKYHCEILEWIGGGDCKVIKELPPIPRNKG